MLLLSKQLVDIAPYSRTTYFKKLAQYKKKAKFKKKLDGNFLTVEEAQAIASNLGFEKEFIEFLKTAKS